MSIFTELIIWASPFLFAGFCWLAHEVYSSFKGDVSDLKKQSHTILKRQERHEVKIDTLDQKTSTICKSIDAVKFTVHELDKRTGDTVDLTRSMRELEKKLEVHEANYGKIMIVLKRVVTIINSKAG